MQGDTGHAQSKMVSDVYSHILDEGRKHNAQLFEKAFYSEETEDNTSPAGGSLDVSALQKLLANPEAAALLAALAKSLKWIKTEEQQWCKPTVVPLFFILIINYIFSVDPNL